MKHVVKIITSLAYRYESDKVIRLINHWWFVVVFVGRATSKTKTAVKLLFHLHIM